MILDDLMLGWLDSLVDSQAIFGWFWMNCRIGHNLLGNLRFLGMTVWSSGTNSRPSAQLIQRCCAASMAFFTEPLSKTHLSLLPVLYLDRYIIYIEHNTYLSYLQYIYIFMYTDVCILHCLNKWIYMYTCIQINQPPDWTDRKKLRCLHAGSAFVGQWWPQVFESFWIHGNQHFLVSQSTELHILGWNCLTSPCLLLRSMFVAHFFKDKQSFFTSKSSTPGFPWLFLPRPPMPRATPPTVSHPVYKWESKRWLLFVGFVAKSWTSWAQRHCWFEIEGEMCFQHLVFS